MKIAINEQINNEIMLIDCILAFDVVVPVRAEVNALVTDALNDAAFGLFVNAVTWSVDKPANWVADKLFTVAAGILVHALVVIDPILSAEIRAISAVLTPA